VVAKHAPPKTTWQAAPESARANAPAHEAAPAFGGEPELVLGGTGLADPAGGDVGLPTGSLLVLPLGPDGGESFSHTACDG
jgi:hypothetical protein